MGFIKDDDVALELDSMGSSALGVDDVVVRCENHISSTFEVTSSIIGADTKRNYEKNKTQNNKIRKKVNL